MAIAYDIALVNAQTTYFCVVLQHQLQAVPRGFLEARRMSVEAKSTNRGGVLIMSVIDL